MSFGGSQSPPFLALAKSISCSPVDVGACLHLFSTNGCAERTRIEIKVLTFRLLCKGKCVATKRPEQTDDCIHVCALGLGSAQMFSVKRYGFCAGAGRARRAKQILLSDSLPGFAGAIRAARSITNACRRTGQFTIAWQHSGATNWNEVPRRDLGIPDFPKSRTSGQQIRRSATFRPPLRTFFAPVPVKIAAAT